jgi:hypothetical protein
VSVRGGGGSGGGDDVGKMRLLMRFDPLERVAVAATPPDFILTGGVY